ncbi:MAG TPA: glycosyl hydrolase family 28-related protein, partial [Mucilaginibacter sp.]|nr:glycosyl hydrolase family 28-related protein [Mucilaginibacter sp.]
MNRINSRIAKIVSIATIALTTMFIVNIANAQVGSSKQTSIQQSIKTIYPTKDWVVSDYVVTDTRFGAKAKPGFDNRAAFQAAIDAAYKNGGGVVYIPAGNYEFRSTQTATKSVRVRQGAEQITKDFSYQYVLNIPTSVQLRGDWADPELNKGKVLGTILEVR